MALLRLTILALVCVCASAQYAEERAPRYIASEPKSPPPPPVAILKQINTHNDDGSYTYGFEAADGSFKIETKEANGEVKGKYGYKDDTGKLRIIEYGANKFGFQPAGEGITVAPPTLVDESREEERRANKGQQPSRNLFRGQEQQQPDYDYDEPAPAPRPAPRPAPVQRQPAYRQPPPPAFTSRSAAPAPPKPQFFSGAAPAPVEPQHQTQSFFSPEPARQEYRAPKQDFRSFQQPQFSQAIEYSQPQQAAPSFPNQQNHQAQPNFQSQQNYQTQPAFQSQPRFNQPSQQFSMLDQLLKQYALPKNGATPYHDVTFGSF